MEGEKKSRLLEDIVVLDLANRQGSFCSKLLADMGAVVLRAESECDQQSDNRWISFYHNANKVRLALNWGTLKGKRLLRQWIERSDILVETFSPDQKDALGLTAKQTSQLNPRLIHLSITGFGASGPKRAYTSTDTVVSAFGGQLFVSGTSLGPPTLPICGQSFYTASLFGATAALLSLRKRTITGRGCFIDLSNQEAVVSALDPVMIQYFAEQRIVGRSNGNPDSSFSLLPCKDGYIQITISRNWDTLLDLMNAEGKSADLTKKKYRTQSYRRQHHGHIVDVVSNWTRNHTKGELFKLGQAIQFPWAPVVSPEEIARSPQLKARKFFSSVSLPRQKGKMIIPGIPYKFHTSDMHLPASAPQKNLAIHSPKSSDLLRGIRVLDLTRMLAGPYATRILGDFGAEIIKVQSGKTARGVEQNDTPYFQAWNRNKRSICLDFDRSEARDIFLRLVAISDIVVENFSPRVLKNLRLTYHYLKTVKPDLIMASISATGQTGPWKNYVGYAPTFHALSGITHSAMEIAGAPADIGNSYGDIVAGLYAALAMIASIQNREKTGQGQYIDLSAYEAACTVLGPMIPGTDSAYVYAASCGVQGKTPNDFGGCYPCAGNDRWCVFHIRNEIEWRAFCAVCTLSELQSQKFSKPEMRRKHRSELDRNIARWTAKHKAETLVRQLQAAGIAAGVVQNAEDLANDPQLAARYFFIHIGSKSSDQNISDRSALWPWNERRSNWKPAPRLGEDNEYVYQTLLGYSATQYRDLKKQGIIA